MIYVRFFYSNKTFITVYNIKFHNNKDATFYIQIERLLCKRNNHRLTVSQSCSHCENVQEISSEIFLHRLLEHSWFSNEAV